MAAVYNPIRETSKIRLRPGRLKQAAKGFSKRPALPIEFAGAEGTLGQVGN